MPMPLKDRAGQRHGRLLAVRYIREKQKWFCVCDCGKEVLLYGATFAQNLSCGCWNTEKTIERNTKHGASPRKARAAEYGIYAGMIQRCYNSSQQAYRYYGARGITICDRWRYGNDVLGGYECFIADMGPRPTPDHTIDRIDCNGNYEPSNCRWLHKSDQSMNRRGRRLITFRGEEMPVAQAAKMVGLPRDIVYDRLKNGWSIDEALSTPKLAPFGGIGPERFQARFQTAGSLEAMRAVCMEPRS